MEGRFVPEADMALMAIYKEDLEAYTAKKWPFIQQALKNTSNANKIIKNQRR